MEKVRKISRRKKSIAINIISNNMLRSLWEWKVKKRCCGSIITNNEPANLKTYIYITCSSSESKPRGLYFSNALFEELVFGGAYIRRACLRREICVSKSIGLALWLEVNLRFLLCFTLYLRAIFQVQAPGGLIFGGGDWTEGFLRYRIGGLIFGGAYFRNFTVVGSTAELRLARIRK